MCVYVCVCVCVCAFLDLSHKESESDKSDKYVDIIYTHEERHRRTDQSISESADQSIHRQNVDPYMKRMEKKKSRANE